MPPQVISSFMRTLYHLPLCPFSRKVRVVLKEKNLDFDLKQERVWERRPEYLQMNPAAEVPVLVEPDGRAIASLPGSISR